MREVIIFSNTNLFNNVVFISSIVVVSVTGKENVFVLYCIFISLLGVLVVVSELFGSAFSPFIGVPFTIVYTKVSLPGWQWSALTPEPPSINASDIIEGNLVVVGFK